MKRRFIQYPAILAGVRDRAGKFLLRCRRQHFVGVENEDPFVPERQILERPILFLRPRPIEMKLHNLRAVFLGDGERAVRALRIDDEDFVRPPDGLRGIAEDCRLRS